LRAPNCWNLFQFQEGLETSRGAAVLERDEPILGFFDTL
jgi:hypothetical protein